MYSCERERSEIREFRGRRRGAEVRLESSEVEEEELRVVAPTSLAARVLHAGGVENVFRRWFSVEESEKLLKTSQCYLSTTAGPISGMLFISSEKVAFRSDRLLALTSPKGDTLRVPYKVAIPLRKVKTAKPSENKHRPEQKYVQPVTEDGFEFWFMGFVGYQASLQHLQQAIAHAQ